MKRDHTIGTAIRTRRQALKWSLQSLIDASGLEISSGHLATIETKDVAPSVYVAAALAKGLGTTVDSLLRETQDPDRFSEPTVNIQRVPLVTWESASEWAKNPDARRLPSGTEWVVPADTPVGQVFALKVRDESMQSPSGVSFPAGFTLFVDPARKPGVGDYVVAHLGEPTAPVFKKLVRDGSAFYLQSLNPQFPMQQVGDTFESIGVVVGLRAAFDKGGVL
ncbi:helix-turn-helix domain-containing protein [Pseudomonas sp. yb_9]|uniref:helix-turn-helix domain-containing protein n=1 Tax=Pseudomonas sp. yb_9 TaxID=3367222 RepID=UPI00370AEF6A